MSTVYSLPKDVQDFQIMEETTRGTFQAPGTPTNALFVTQSPEIDWARDLNLAVQKVTGSRDPKAVIDTLPDMRFSLSMPNVISPETINFLKRGVNLEAGTGTIEYLFSGVLRFKFGATQYYLKMKSMMIGAGALSLLGYGPWVASPIWMIGKLEAIETAAPTNWTFVSPPTTAQILGKDAGANHVTIRDVDTVTDYNPSVRGLSIAFNNGVFPIPQTGGSEWADIVPTDRSHRIRYILNFKDLNITNIAKLAHEANSTIVIKSGTHTYTGTGGKLSPQGIMVRTDTPNTETIQHIVKSGVLS